MTNQYCNKAVANGETLIDLTDDTATASDVLSGKKFHLKSGQQTTGTCTFNVDASDATAGASEILNGKTAYVGSSKITGSMPNNGMWKGSITVATDEITIPQGYHDGSGYVKIDSTERNKLVANNIRDGITILGVTGNFGMSDLVKPQAKTVTSSFTTQTVTPDASYTHLSQVTVNAIPVTKTDNAAGGYTCTIG